MELPIHIDRSALADFQRRWRVCELAVFGSVLREDFGPDSDIDLLVAFDPDSHWTLFDLAQMQQELVVIFGRNIDLITRQALEASRNYLRRQAILSSVETLNVA